MAGEEWMALFAQVLPERGGLGLAHALAAEADGGRIDRCARAGQPQRQHAVVPAGGRHRQRPAGPAVHRFDGALRALLRQREAQRRPGRRQRQHLERDLDDHAQGAETAGHEARDIEAGDVLHHLAAKPEQPAFAVDDLHAEHEIAHGADAGSARPREASGDHSADGGAGAEGRRLEGQHLSSRRQRRLDVGQRRAAARGDHQLGRLQSTMPP
jgi:hypothetical protein